MLKWTKRADPSGLDDAGSKYSTLILASQPNRGHRIHGRRSTGNLTRAARITNREKQRKSLGSSEISKKIQNRDKENQLVLTPYPNGFHQNIISTPVIAFGSKLDFALRDVRNITPKQNTNSISTLFNAMTPSRKRPLAKTPPDSPKLDRVICSSPKESALVTNASVMVQKTPYASTLPTFDVEYSPCGPTQTVLPNPSSIIVTADSFFNQPRYFQEPLPASKRLKYSSSESTPLSSRFTEIKCNKLKDNGQKSSEKFKEGKLKNETVVESTELIVKDCGNNINNNNDEKKNQNECNDAAFMKTPANFSDTKISKMQTPSAETSLSSSALNDTALDKMIDAILESARKERPSVVRNLAPRKIHLALMQMESESPTYTPAEDPAEDLNKFCDNFQISPNKLIGERTIILEESNSVNEREIRTPETINVKRKKLDKIIANTRHKSNSCHLKRQRAVRRKHLKNDSQHQLQQKNRAEPTNSGIHSVVNEMEPEKPQIASPKTPSDSYFAMRSFLKNTTDELANMNTPVNNSNDSNVTYAQQPHCGTISICSKISSESTPSIHTNDLQASSTPTYTETVNAIRRCLTFSDSSSRSNSITIDDSLEKRKSTASSTNSIASMSTISNSARINNDPVRGSLELSIFLEGNKINVHGELVWSHECTRAHTTHNFDKKSILLLSA